jgi:hypothetical protein
LKPQCRPLSQQHPAPTRLSPIPCACTPSLARNEFRFNLFHVFETFLSPGMLANTALASLSTTPCSYLTFPTFHALTQLPLNETNSFHVFPTFLRSGTLEKTALATLSTTPCSYTTFPPFRALTHLPWHETNSFHVSSTFIALWALETTTPPTLSTTPCSYPTFPTFHALTQLPLHETNSFYVFPTFLSSHSKRQRWPLSQQHPPPTQLSPHSVC